MELDAYLDDLGALDEHTLRAALALCAQANPRFFPTSLEIQQAVDNMRLAIGGGLTGETAWAQLWRDVISQYSEANNRIISARIRAGGPGYDWPDDATKDIVRNHLGLSLGVHDLAMIERDAEREKYRRLFIKLYDERRTTAQAVERAEQAIDAPNVRRLAAVGE